MRAGFAVLCIALFVGSASAADADAIGDFLTIPVEDRLSTALDMGDHRYLGVYGDFLEIPGVADAALPSSAVLVIPGTSADGDPELTRSAREYAARYNRLLAERLSKIGG